MAESPGVINYVGGQGEPQQPVTVIRTMCWPRLPRLVG